MRYSKVLSFVLVVALVVAAGSMLFAAGNKRTFPSQTSSVQFLQGLTKANSQVDTLYFTPSEAVANLALGISYRDSLKISHIVVYRRAGSGAVSGTSVGTLGDLTGTSATDSVITSAGLTATAKGEGIYNVVVSPVTSRLAFVITYAASGNSIDSTGVEYAIHQSFTGK